MKRHLLLSAILAVLLLLPATAWAQLTIVGHYTGGNIFFDIATFTKDGKKVALLGISHKVSIAFRKDEWNTFAAIWQKAKRSKSDSFQFIDSYKEAPSDGYRSLLTVAVGPGVQFTINDKAGTYVFVLPPKDFFRVDADIAKVATYLGSN